MFDRIYILLRISITCSWTFFHCLLKPSSFPPPSLVGWRNWKQYYISFHIANTFVSTHWNERLPCCIRVQRHVAGRGQPLHQARVPGRGAHGLLAGPGAPGPAHPLRAELLLPKLAIYLISGFRVGGNLSDDNSVIRAIWSTCRRGEKLNWIGFEF